MFGGLDLRGGGGVSGSAGNVSGKDDTTATPSTTTSSSAFDFLNPSAPSAAAAPASAAASYGTSLSSGFSFMNATGTSLSVAAHDADASTDTTEPASGLATSNSAFSFLSSATAPTSALSSMTSAADTSIPTSSSFDFLQTTTTTTTGATSTTSALEAVKSATTAVATNSAFDFLSSSPTSNPHADANASTTGTATATTTMASAPSASGTNTSSFSFLTPSTTASTAAHTSTTATATATTMTMTTTASLDVIPTGSGVTFGTGLTSSSVMASTKPIIKKRNRTSKIGVGTAATTARPETMNDRSVSSGNEELPAPSATGATPKHAAAEEANRRAESFLHEKIKQQSASQYATTGSTPDTHHPRQQQQQGLDDGHGGDDDDVEDDIVAAAKAAAEEAQHMQLPRHGSRSLTDRMGLTNLLFRSARSSPPTTTPGSIHNNHTGNSNINSSHHVMVSSSPPPRMPPATTTSSSSSSASGTGGAVANKETASSSTMVDDAVHSSEAERLQREQEQVQRAAQEWHVRQQGHTTTAYSAPVMSTAATNQQPTSSSMSKPVAVIPVPAAAAATTTPAMAVKSSSSWTSPTGKYASKQLIVSTTHVPAAPMIATQTIFTPSPTDRFRLLLQQFRREVVYCLEQAGRVRQQESHLQTERDCATKKLNLARQQRRQAEQELNSAVEQEDFELADRLGNAFNQHEIELNEAAAIVNHIDRALSELEKQKKTVVDQVAGCFVTMQSRLQTFLTEQESNGTEDTSDAKRRFEVVSRQLSAEHDRLQNDLKMLERDEALVKDERREVETAISEQAGQYERLRDEARTKLGVVEGEIEDLRKQLAAKLDVAAKLRTEMAGHDENVLKVRVKFARQLNRVQKKETTIRDNRDEWELEKGSFDRQREEHESAVAAHSEALLARDELLRSLKREVEMADTLATIVSREMSVSVKAAAASDNKKDDNGDGNDDDDDEDDVALLSQLQADVVRCEAAVSEKQELVQAATAWWNTLQGEVLALEARLPEWEAMKKAAASRRDFKTAGKASKEIKDATARIVECQETLIAQAEERKARAEQDLKDLQEELEVKRLVFTEKEGASAKATMRRIADQIQRLCATKETVCGKHVLSTMPTMQGVGALVLEGQIKALRQQGETYGNKYGGWNDILRERGLAEEDENPSSADEAGGDDIEETPAEVDFVVTGEDNAAKGESAVDGKQVDAPAEPTEPSDDDDAAAAGRLEKMRQFRVLSKRLKDAEESLEAAASNEDYDRAAELDDELQQLLAEVQGLSLSDEDMDAALADDFLETLSVLPMTVPLEELLTNANDHEQTDNKSTNDEMEVQASAENDNLEDHVPHDGEESDSQVEPPNTQGEAVIHEILSDKEGKETDNDNKHEEVDATGVLDNDKADTNGTMTIHTNGGTPHTAIEDDDDDN